jgi:drug/metabolite transporter (DMT)-like permease
VMATALQRPLAPALIPSEAWLGILGVGVLATFVAIVAFYAGAQRVGAAQAALISTVEPIWTITLAAILFGELLQPIQLVGGVLIIGGVLLAQWPTSASIPLRPRIRIADE